MTSRRPKRGRRNVTVRNRRRRAPRRGGAGERAEVAGNTSYNPFTSAKRFLQKNLSKVTNQFQRNAVFQIFKNAGDLKTQVNHRDVARLGMICGGFIRAAWIPVSSSATAEPYGSLSTQSQMNALMELFSATSDLKLSNVTGFKSWLLNNSTLIDESRFTFIEFSKVAENGHKSVKGYIAYRALSIQERSQSTDKDGRPLPANPSIKFADDAARIAAECLKSFNAVPIYNMELETNRIFGFDIRAEFNGFSDVGNKISDTQLFISSGMYPVLSDNSVVSSHIVYVNYANLPPNSTHAVDNYMTNMTLYMQANTEMFGVSEYKFGYDCTKSSLDTLVNALSAKTGANEPTFNKVGERVLLSHLALAFAGPVYKDYEMLVKSSTIPAYLEWAKKHLAAVRTKGALVGGALVGGALAKTIPRHNLGNFSSTRNTGTGYGQVPPPQMNARQPAGYVQQYQYAQPQYQQVQAMPFPQDQYMQVQGQAMQMQPRYARVQKPLPQRPQPAAAEALPPPPPAAPIPVAAPPPAVVNTPSVSSADVELARQYIQEVKDILSNGIRFDKITNAHTSSMRTALLSVVMLLVMDPNTHAHVDFDMVYSSMPIAESIQRKLAMLKSVKLLLTKSNV